MDDWRSLREFHGVQPDEQIFPPRSPPTPKKNAPRGAYIRVKPNILLKVTVVNPITLSRLSLQPFAKIILNVYSPKNPLKKYRNA